MAPDPRCAALAAAKTKKGMSYSQIATATSSSEQRIVDICTGQAKPTDAEFKAITSALGVADTVSHTGVHATI